MQVELVTINADQVWKRTLELAANTTIMQVLKEHQLDGMQNLQVGIFGELKPLDYVLQEYDRLEIYQPLLQDPKLRRMVQVNRSTLPRRCR